MRRQLIARFPNCFKPYESVKRPLKIKIHEDILAACPEFNRRTLGDALRWYTSVGNYPRCLVAGAQRFDLNGDPAGVVTEDEVRRSKAVTTGGELQMTDMKEISAARQIQVSA